MPRAGSKSQGKTRSGASPRKKPEPTVYICPYTEQNVYIQRATLADLKSKSTYHAGGKKRLWMLTSSQLRHELYTEAAQALASVEQSLLPSFGGRSWEVTCGMSEDSSNILFRAWKGKMELAVLPHLIEKIPEPPTWPGRRSRQLDEFFENADEEDTSKLQSREISTLSSVAWDLKHQYPEPNVSIKWKSPDHKIFNSRKAAWEHAREIAKKEVVIDKHILGIGASGKLLQPTIPSGPTTLKVGKMRFERDGLWVVNQELEWQEDRPHVLLEIEEEKKRQEEEEKEAEMADMAEEEAEEKGDNEADECDGRNNEASGLEKEVSRKRKLTPLLFFIQSRRHDYRKEKEQSMIGAKPTLRETEIKLRELWKTLDKVEQDKWNEKLAAHLLKQTESEDVGGGEHQHSLGDEIVADDQKSMPLQFFIRAKRHGYRKDKQEKMQSDSFTLREAEHELTEKWDKLSEREQKEWKEKLNTSSAAMSVVENFECVQTKTNALNGQQESANVAERKPCKQATAALAIESGSKSPRDDSLAQPVPVSVKVSSIVLPVETSEETLADRLGEQKQEVLENSVVDGSAEAALTNDRMLSEPKRADFVKSNEQVEGQSTGAPMEIEEEKKEEDAPVFKVSNQLVTDGGMVTAPDMEQVSQITPATTAGELETKLANRVGSPSTTVKKKAKRKSSSRRKKPTEKACQRWCLTNDQIDLCYTACMSHYEDVMRTVKARDLVRELADGFDVFRERGRGRFDMELPAFDTGEFDFLNDLKKAPWMPIVKTILGDDIVLIHKGCFLSMPDAETQVYHQDGVHLTTQTQKPCHAINVFVPLVDLTTRNGPTEFCLGSHILGNDGFDKDYAETPKPRAGTPVIFDYRLGHRGLGNSSTKCRPIVYCTYARGAADGKEFRDSVNFSRKRYHKIGKLANKPLSREERRLNRKRSMENRQMQQQLQKIAKIEQQETSVQKEGKNEPKGDKAATDQYPGDEKSKSQFTAGEAPSKSIAEKAVESDATPLLADQTKLHHDPITATTVQKVEKASTHP